MPSNIVVARRFTGAAPYSARDLITAIFYHKRAMVIAFLIPVLLALGVGFRMRPIFIAQARLLVLNGSDYVFHPAPGQGGSDIALDRNQIVQGELQILQSSTLAADVLHQVGLDRIYPTLRGSDEVREGLAESRFAADLTVSVVPLSSVIELGFSNRDRAVATQVLKTLIEQYLQRRKAVFDTTPTDTVNLQRTQFAEQLHRAEVAVTQFGAAHSITNIDEQITLLLQQTSENLTAEQVTDQSIREATAKLVTLREQIQTVPPTVQIFAESNRTRESDAMADNLVALLAKQRDLRSRFNDDFPILANMNQQIEELQRRMAEIPARDASIAREGRNTVYDSLRGQEITLAASLSGLQAKREELSLNAVALQKRLDELSLNSQEYHDLLRSRDVLDQSFRTIERSSVEAQQAAALERLKSPNIRVVQAPEAPAVGRNPQPIVWAGGAVLGIMAAGFVAIVCSAFRRVFVTVHDCETALDLPVLVTVQLWRSVDDVESAPGRLRDVAGAWS